MTDLPILEISDFIADPVAAADFPETVLRHRNRRAAESIGLAHLSEADWIRHFGRFEALPGNLPEPLALRYHGHQFGTYNPEIGDGRGFLFAQLKDARGRWLDLGTKGSGQTPYSRFGDGRLTLKGGVREILASAYLEALGVKVSKAFSLIETGEQLQRNDEPSPTRSSVLVRLSHSHIRIGSFQRLAALGLKDEMARLIDHCTRHYYPEADDTNSASKAARLLELMTRDSAAMVASWMAAGFVHGVMNTDNFNLTGETFDFGPYRFLPHSDPNFTAAYFDHAGLYRFGAQPGRGFWNMQQLASSLTLVTGEDTEPLIDALRSYEPAYQDALVDHVHARLGLSPLGDGSDIAFIAELFSWMTESGVDWQGLFHDWFCGETSAARARASQRAELYATADFKPIRSHLAARTAVSPDRLETASFQPAAPENLLYDEIEAIWAAIAESDDWSAFDTKLQRIEQFRRDLALGQPLQEG